MRVREKLEKKGYFWLPDNPGRKIPGTLSINDGGEIELEIIESLREETLGEWNNRSGIDRILGHVEEHGPVTLEDCFYLHRTISFTSSGVISPSKVGAYFAYLGIAHDQGEICFDEITFSVEGLNELITNTGIEVRHSSDYSATTIEYNKPEETTYRLKNGFSLSLLYRHSLPFGSATHEAKITEQVYFKLTKEGGTSFQDYRDVVHKIVFLLCLATGEVVSLDYIGSTSPLAKTGDRDKQVIPIRIYHLSRPFSESSPKLQQHDFLFLLSKDNLGPIVDKWLDAFSKFGTALYLYFSAIGRARFLEEKFIALAQVLEIFHRNTSNESMMSEREYEELVEKLMDSCPQVHKDWLEQKLRHANEPNLRRRIDRIIEPFKDKIGNKKEIAAYVNNIVNTRNYLTHYSQALGRKPVSASEMLDLSHKMDGIFILHLLKELDFNASAIERIAKENYRLRSMLEGI